MNVIISGYGAMGKVLLDEMSNYHNLALCGVVDSMTDFGLDTFDDITTSCDVIIDFSHPNNLKEILTYAVSSNTALVIATTGMNEKQEQLIKKASQKIPILYTKNTSLGVNILNQVVKILSRTLHDFDIEIIEKHHNQKQDAPSGTANLFLESIQETRDVTPVYGRKGNSKRDPSDVTIHAVRGGTIPGEHTIMFAKDDEIIELKHMALSKRIFAKGAITAAQFISQKKSGLFTMDDAL